MKLTLAAAALILGGAGAALAQQNGAQPAPSSGAGTPTVPAPQMPAATVNQTAQTTNSPSPSAVQTNGAVSRTSAAPVAGRNSYTEGQAARKIAAAGFSDVKALKKDSHGIWRGQATKDGNPVGVALDYQGNVVSP